MMKNNPPHPSLNTKILAIDTSCDDTAVAILDQNFTILSNVVSSQIELHRPYGGVFPTVAKLAHQENIDWCLELALKRAQLTWSALDAIAVTVGPGLAPALEIGLNKARELATTHHLPIIPVNHVEAHAWSSQLRPKSSKNKEKASSPSTPNSSLASQTAFPILSLVVSGGHTEFILITAPGQYQILGQTLDDAAGECLDKIGRLLNLGYPAGPTIEQFAQLGNAKAYPFPLPLTMRRDFDLSFSGLKTFARNLVKDLENQILIKDSNQNQLDLSPNKEIPKISTISCQLPTPPRETKFLPAQTIYDLCASAQAGVFRHILYKLNKLLLHLYQTEPAHFPTQIWLGGGVAANIEFRHQIRLFLRSFSQKTPRLIQPLTLATPYAKKFCGDNAAMIALVAMLKYPRAISDLTELMITDPTSSQLDRQPGLVVSSWNLSQNHH